MGKRDRERIEQILNGDETPISQQAIDCRKAGITDKTISKVEGVTRKIVEKTMVPKWTGMSLPQQVGVARKMLRAAGMMNFRANFLKPSGFPDDISDKAKAGWSNEQISAYYWECPEWVSFWKDLGLDEANFQTLLPGTAPQPVAATTKAEPEAATHCGKKALPSWYYRLFGSHLSGKGTSSHS